VGLFLKEKIKDVVNKKGKYKQEKKEASDKINKHTNSLYSTKIYNASRAH